MKNYLVALIASAVLAGCGGGGGGSVTPPTTGGGGTKTPTLGMGFQKSGGSVGPQNRKASAIHAQADPILVGSLIPFATFIVPDSYVPSNMNPGLTYYAVAYYDTSNGSQLPPVLPQVTFTETGNPLPFGSALTPPAPSGSGSKTAIGAESVGQPSSVGQTTVTASAAGQNVDLVANTYPGLGLNVSTGNYPGAPTGVSFTATGATPDSVSPDITIDTSQSVSAISAPHGVVEVNKPIDQVTTADFVQANAVTVLRDANLCNIDANFHTFVFNTAAGVLVKFQVLDYGGPNVAAGVCTYYNVFGPYLIAGQNGFAY